jgi:peptide deformylase
MVKLAMVVENIIQIGNPILRAKNKKISDTNNKEVKKTIQDLTDSMRHYNLVGMAAPQIGINLKIFVTEIRPTPSRKSASLDKLRVFINPKIVWKSKKEIIMYEGCGSVSHSDFFGPVKRSEKVKITAIDEKGKKIKLKADGLLARVIQHEYDHLIGIEFVEKIIDMRKIMSKSEYIKMMEKSE